MTQTATPPEPRRQINTAVSAGDRPRTVAEILAQAPSRSRPHA